MTFREEVKIGGNLMYGTAKIHPNFDDRFLVDMRFVEVANMKLFCQFCKHNFRFSICEKRIKELIV